MVKDNEVYPINTVVRIKKTGEFALIKQQSFLRDGKNFLNYLAVIENRGNNGLYALYHDEIDLEALPKKLTSRLS